MGQVREGFDDHFRCSVIPIFDWHHQVIAGLSVSFPNFSYDEAREPGLVKRLHDAGSGLGRQSSRPVFPLDPPEAAHQ